MRPSLTIPTQSSSSASISSACLVFPHSLFLKLYSLVWLFTLCSCTECKLSKVGTLSISVTAIAQHLKICQARSRSSMFVSHTREWVCISASWHQSLFCTSLCPSFTSILGDRGHFLFLWLLHTLHWALDLCLWTWGQKACLSSEEVRLTSWGLSCNYLNSDGFAPLGCPFKRRKANLWRIQALKCCLKNYWAYAKAHANVSVSHDWTGLPSDDQTNEKRWALEFIKVKYLLHPPLCSGWGWHWVKGEEGPSVKPLWGDCGSAWVLSSPLEGGVTAHNSPGACPRDSALQPVVRNGSSWGICHKKPP